MDRPCSADRPAEMPSFSPASIAGRVRMILPTSSFLKAVIAIAIARYACGTGRTDTKDDHLLADRIDIRLLSECLWLDRLAVDRMANTVPVDRHDCILLLFIRKRNRVVSHSAPSAASRALPKCPGSQKSFFALTAFVGLAVSGISPSRLSTATCNARSIFFTY